MDAELAALEAAEKAFKDGRAAFQDGDLELAEWRLLVAAAHGFGESATYLAAIYHHHGKTGLAQSWAALARANGLPVFDVIRAMDPGIEEQR
ncbi:hypothetical protein AB0383_17005 [Amycolatopsis sp. NPDC051373]|uniref:hypothetical protein n=1 Tax=Amycolatopsis sp. NPDC051373 TaxID=3155801 RepID=UPI00345110D0